MPKKAPTPSFPAIDWRDRIVELRRCLPSALADHSLQHKIHGDFQRSVMCGVLKEVGKADALRAYVSPSTGALTLLDGHLRKSLGETPWPTLILDVTDDEAAYILLTGDEVTGLAKKEQTALARLLEEVHSADASVQQMLRQLAEQVSLPVEEAPVVLSPPEEFPAYDEDIEVEHTCPRCGYQFSGGS